MGVWGFVDYCASVVVACFSREFPQDMILDLFVSGYARTDEGGSRVSWFDRYRLFYSNKMEGFSCKLSCVFY